LVKSQEWTKRIKELENHFEQNDTKEGFKLAKQITQIKNNSPAIKGFETEEGVIILEEPLINAEVQKHYSKLLYDEKAGTIRNKKIEDYKSSSELFVYDDVAKAIDQCDLSKGIGTDWLFGEIFKISDVRAKLIP
jgi:hypothetical protein